MGATPWAAAVARPMPPADDQGNDEQRCGGQGGRKQEWHIKPELSEQDQADRGHRQLCQPGHQVVDPRRLATAGRRGETTHQRVAAGVERGPSRAVNDTYREQCEEAGDQVRGAADGQRDSACRQHAARTPLIDETAHPRPQHNRWNAERGDDQPDQRLVSAAIDHQQRQDRLDQKLRGEGQKPDDAQGEERPCEELRPRLDVRMCGGRGRLCRHVGHDSADFGRRCLARRDHLQRHSLDHVFLPADHLAPAELDEQIARINVISRRGALGVQQEA